MLNTFAFFFFVRLQCANERQKRIKVKRKLIIIIINTLLNYNRINRSTYEQQDGLRKSVVTANVNQAYLSSSSISILPIFLSGRNFYNWLVLFFTSEFSQNTLRFTINFFFFLWNQSCMLWHATVCFHLIWSYFSFCCSCSFHSCAFFELLTFRCPVSFRCFF